MIFSMDAVFQEQNSRQDPNREIEYDPLMEEEVSLSLELDDLFPRASSMNGEETLTFIEFPDGGDEVCVMHPAPHDAVRHDELVDTTDYPDHNTHFEQSPFEQRTVPDSIYRLTVIERTLGELQKYIGELVDLVRLELQHAHAREQLISEETPPLPDVMEIDVSLIDDDIPGDAPCIEEQIVQLPASHAEQEGTHIGVFNGQSMVTAEGREFTVPENYASKSRLVEGDTLKLTFSPEGRMLYKQIGPARRRRITGILEHDPLEGQYSVLCPEGRFRVLGASVAFFKGVPGDEVLLVVPVGGPYRWGAIQSMLKNTDI